jgi:hypothetical protein
MGIFVGTFQLDNGLGEFSRIIASLALTPATATSVSRLDKPAIRLNSSTLVWRRRGSAGMLQSSSVRHKRRSRSSKCVRAYDCATSGGRSVDAVVRKIRSAVVENRCWTTKRSIHPVDIGGIDDCIGCGSSA